MKDQIRWALSRVFLRLGVTPRWIVISRHGYRLRLYPSSLSVALWYRPDDLADIEDVLRSYLRTGDVMIDVGANIGTTALTAASVVGPLGSVVAVEAHPRIHSFLVGNIALNHATNVRAVHAAVGPEDGVTRFSDRRRSDDMNAVRDAGEIEVPLCRLDSLDLPSGEIALLKVDVEGYERAVFEGAPETLARTACVLFEALDHLYAKFGYGLSDVVSLLARHGLQTCQIDREGALVPIGDNLDQWSKTGGNLLAVRDLAAVQDRFRLHPGRLS